MQESRIKWVWRGPAGLSRCRQGVPWTARRAFRFHAFLGTQHTGLSLHSRNQNPDTTVIPAFAGMTHWKSVKTFFKKSMARVPEGTCSTTGQPRRSNRSSSRPVPLRREEHPPPNSHAAPRSLSARDRHAPPLGVWSNRSELAKNKDQAGMALPGGSVPSSARCSVIRQMGLPVLLQEFVEEFISHNL